MQAVRYHFSIPKYLVTKAAGRWTPAVYTARAFSALSLDDVPPPSLPGPDWLAIEPVYAGICGTDLGTITGKTSPALAPFASFPATLGHEVVGRVVDVGPGAGEFRPGDRIVVDPWISCRVRGLDPCPACERGTPFLCRRAAEGRFGPGMLIGYCSALPGGWSRRMVVHVSQAHRVPDGMSDERAVLVEPLSVALHGVLRAVAPDEHEERDFNRGLAPGFGPGETVLVIGAGTIGLAVVAAIRLLGLKCRVAVLARYPFQEELARALGADAVIPRGRNAAVEAAKSLTSAPVYRPPIGPPVITGGFGAVFDCAGTTASISDALRVVQERGRVIVLGGAGQLAGVDWTFVWMREVHVLGSCGYGFEPAFGRHTYSVLFDLLAKADLPVERLITHRFPLTAYREAIRCNLERAKTGAVKTVFCESP